jgi:bifunctional DNase/RNase
MLIEMAIRGLMMDPITNLPIVILRDVDGQRVLPIWVGAVEANAVALQIENVAPPRPLTHDLIRNLLTEFGAVLERVVIHDLKDSTFYAYLELKRDGEYSRIDVRPSDALALALRTKAPIYVHPRVIERASSSEISTEDADQERLQQWLESLDPDDLGYKM